MKTIVRDIAYGVVVGAVGVFLGIVLAWFYIDRYMVRASGQITLTQPLSASELHVDDWYGEQKTAPVHIFEPKASDVYLQYAPATDDTYNPQEAGRNE